MLALRKPLGNPRCILWAEAVNVAKICTLPEVRRPVGVSNPQETHWEGPIPHPAARRTAFAPPGSVLGPWVDKKVTIYFPSLAMAPVQENKNVTFSFAWTEYAAGRREGGAARHGAARIGVPPRGAPRSGALRRGAARRGVARRSVPRRQGTIHETMCNVVCILGQRVEAGQGRSINSSQDAMACCLESRPSMLAAPLRRAADLFIAPWRRTQH